VLEGLRKHCPGIITQVSTGGRSGAGRERGGMLSLRPDMASLASGSVNFPTRVYENTPDLIEWLAEEMLRYGVKPEIEAFDLSMIFQAVALQKAGRIKPPLHVQFVMGVKNAMPVDREVFEFYVRTLHRLAPDATWTGAGIGRDQLTLVRWSLELGGHCRTGLEDNVRLDKTRSRRPTRRWCARSPSCAPNTAAARPAPPRHARCCSWRRRVSPPEPAGAAMTRAPAADAEYLMRDTTSHPPAHAPATRPACCAARATR
jgi:hypothetical protein